MGLILIYVEGGLRFISESYNTTLLKKEAINMLDFVIKYWVEFALGLVAAGLGASAFLNADYHFVSPVQ